MSGETGEVRDEKLDAEAEARRRVALVQIRQYPDPALRMRANEVEDFGDGLRRLVERLEHLLHDANGLGLAATQIGVLDRKSTRLNSSHVSISYAVFCLKKK